MADTTSLRRHSAWLVGLPLLVAGSLVAHQLAYLIVAGDRAGAVLQATGHGYLDQVPAGAALGVACLVLGLILAGVDRVRGGRAAAVPAWAVALAPVAGFALQEHLERFAAQGHMPWSAALDGTFLVGLVLQVPFALAAYGLARRLQRVVATLVDALRASRRHHGRPASAVLPVAPASAVASVIARCIAPRGPPALQSV